MKSAVVSCLLFALVSVSCAANIKKAAVASQLGGHLRRGSTPPVEKHPKPLSRGPAALPAETTQSTLNAPGSNHTGLSASGAVQAHKLPDIIPDGPSGPDGYADTKNHQRRTQPEGDKAGNKVGWGPDAADREFSPTGDMPDNFSLLSALFGDFHAKAHPKWDTACTWNVILTGFIMAWSFKNLKVISDVYFVPSTMSLARQLGMPNDVAGATLLAFGSSAPEFCTNVVATFFIVNECGVGDIIGSAIHNILLVVGVSGLFATRVLNLWWYPLSRDCFFYMLSIVELVVFLWDEYIAVWEAAVMCMTYGVYCMWMFRNQKLYERICEVIKKPPTIPEEGDDDDDEGEGIVPYDPVEILWRYTMAIPNEAPLNCFIFSLLHIAWLSYVMVDSATRFGLVMGIPTLFMGLVFLAAGTSIPDAFASMGAAKRGEGDMAVSNALGSNIFDILLGLGCPWLIARLMGKPIVFLGINKLLTWVSLLAVVLVIFMAVIIGGGWKLDHKVGGSLTIMYFGYVGYALLSSYGVVPASYAL